MTTDRQQREAAVAAELELDSMILKARRINRAIIVTLLVIGALLVGFNWSTPAHAATRRVDVCTIEVPKSWTKGLQKQANRAFVQQVKVIRTNEWKMFKYSCDVYVSTSTDRREVILSDARAAEWESTAKAGTKRQRPAAIVNALREAGVR
jgi:hypothetical protein